MPPNLPVQLNTLPAVTVAYQRHVGPYGSAGIPALWQGFVAWSTAQGWMQPRRKMYGISMDNPAITPPEDCRYDACIEADAGFSGDEHSAVQTLPGGLYACAEFIGGSQDISAAWQWLCGEWLTGSGYVFDPRPVFELYAEDYVQDPENGRFHCQLCIPLRPR